MMTKNLKNAFTLAETLITMTVLAVIFVLVVSTVLRKIPNENAIKWQKAYGAVGEVVKSLSANEQIFPPLYECTGASGEPALCGSYTIVGKYIQILDGATYKNIRCDGSTYSCSATYPDCCNKNIPSGFKLLTSTDSGTKSVNGPYFCEQFAKSFNLEGGANCSYDSGSQTKINFTTTDDISFIGLQQGFDSSQDYITICIDINGEQSPNVGCASDQNRVDKDQFRLQIGYQGHVEVGLTASAMYDASQEKNLSATKYDYDSATNCEPSSGKTGSAGDYCIERWALTNIYKE